MTVDTQAAPVDRAAGAPRRSVASRIVGRLGGTAVQVVLVLIALVWLVPTIGLFIASLRSSADNAAGGWWTVLTAPAQLTLANYGNLLDNDSITRGFVNTVMITVPTTVLVVVVAALAAYAFAWIDFPGRDWLFLGVVALLVVPVQVGLIPLIQLFGNVGLFGTIPGIVLFHTAYGLPFAIFLLRNYFAGIPRDLLEAARMDGGTEWTIFRRVIFPLGGPAIASLAIFQFLWVWNDLLIALIFGDEDSYPLTVAIQQQTRQFGSNIDIISSGAFLSMLVPLVVFFAFQRYFVQGVLAGSVK
ncbi:MULTISPECIES: carbohydrate ABC transporter permease [Thermomonospora]|uniref:Binding-protein-dependent transport systems inner membrane component n=2 Tax=Thermomonospora TaxID=2019 RepID=D1A2U5_THECD|nr:MULTISPECIES: carbohydrate ABC transporter permease [Thermomonospora]ACY97893.1 binding-protein-dependent transport systems inner membrane component [Thermomonospora curvata DSM 43183]PKK14174.1 MAG: carbohydrate ABC transporter permease [Thermomonospora sp. CIF 1]